MNVEIHGTGIIGKFGKGGECPLLGRTGPCSFCGIGDRGWSEDRFLPLASLPPLPGCGILSGCKTLPGCKILPGCLSFPGPLDEIGMGEDALDLLEDRVTSLPVDLVEHDDVRFLEELVLLKLDLN